jgi:hypothetical protein
MPKNVQTLGVPVLLASVTDADLAARCERHRHGKSIAMRSPRCARRSPRRSTSYQPRLCLVSVVRYRLFGIVVPAMMLTGVACAAAVPAAPPVSSTAASHAAPAASASPALPQAQPADNSQGTVERNRDHGQAGREAEWLTRNHRNEHARGGRWNASFKASFRSWAPSVAIRSSVACWRRRCLQSQRRTSGKATTMSSFPSRVRSPITVTTGGVAVRCTPPSTALSNAWPSGVATRAASATKTPAASAPTRQSGSRVGLSSHQGCILLGAEVARTQPVT